MITAGAVVVLISAGSATAQQADPFKSVNFMAPIAAASDSSAVVAEAQAPAAPAAPADPGYVTFFKGTELGGLADVYYSFYSTKTPALFHSFDSQQNSFTPSMVEIWFNKAPTADSRVGFKIKTIFGPAAKTILGADDPSLVNVLEGFVSYLAPVGKGLQVDVGKFVTPAGAEVIEAKDDWNYSRGLLFQNAIPYYHAGVRATYTVSDQVTLAGYLVNGWNNTSDNNTGKTVIGSVTYKPAIMKMPLTIIENYIGGPEKSGTNEGWRHLSDTVVTYTVNDMVSVLGNVDYARETPVGGGEAAHYFGVAGAVKFQATPLVAISPRVEYFDDSKAGVTGFAQKLKSLTLTAEMKPADNFMFRIEYRGDFSDLEAFVDDKAAPKKNQQGILFGLLYSFSTK